MILAGAWFLSALVGVAWGVPLVYDGGVGSELAAAASQRTGLPVEQLEPTDLNTLLKALPRTLGQATLRHCAGAPTRVSELRASAVRAEAWLREGKEANALDELDLAIAGLGCLSERVEVSTASRLFLLRGVMLAGGDPEAARAELRTALSFSESVSYDSWLPPAGLPLFEEVKAETVRVKLQIAPASAGPAVNGVTVAASVELRTGLHLVQIPSTAGLRSAWLTIAGEAALVVPGAYRRPVLERLAGEDRGEIERLLQATLGGEPAYVSVSGGLWLVSDEGTVTLVAPPVVEPVSSGRRGKK